MRGFTYSNPGYVAQLSGGEKVPAGWLGPVAPTIQSCLFIAENGEATPGGWGRSSAATDTPSGRIIFYPGAGGQLSTTAYAGGSVQLYAPGGAGAGSIRLRVTRTTTGEVLYEQTKPESQQGGMSYLLHEVALPVFAAWRLEIFTVDAPCNLTDIT